MTGLRLLDRVLLFCGRKIWPTFDAQITRLVVRYRIARKNGFGGDQFARWKIRGENSASDVEESFDLETHSSAINILLMNLSMAENFRKLRTVEAHFFMD
jgi:hypothetical protein